MTNVLPFKPKTSTDNDVDRFLEFAHGLIFDARPSTDRMDFTMGTVTVSAQNILRSYEEQHWKHFIEDKIMAASGLTSLMMATPDITRTELFDVAAVDVQLWSKIPHLEHFITASNCEFEYNFRTVNYDLAQIAFQIQRGD
jgi:hypothetical protein